MSDGEDPRGGWRPAANPWLIATTVTLAAFMEVLDTTIVNVSLPHIAGSLSAGQDESTWTLTSYLVANGIVLPISGYFSRLLGRKRYFLLCIGAFTVCSFLCGVADSLWQLILFRLLQGFFGGGLQPSQQSIILDTFEPHERGRAFSVVAVATIIAPVLGPTVGGWITDNYSWRWIFFINLPVGIIAFLGVSQLVEDPPWQKDQEGAVSIDAIGLGLIALGFGCLQVALDRGEYDDWLRSGFIRTMFLLSAAGLVGAVFWLLYARKPIVDLRILRDRNFAVGCTSIFAMALVLYSSAVLLPQLSQTRLGYTAMWAGLLLSPGALVVCFTIPVTSRLMRLVQTRYLIAAGFAIMGWSFLYTHTLSPTIDFTTLTLMRCAQAAGLALLFVPISTLTYQTLPAESNADAAALFTMFRNLAGSIGISAATALVASRSQVRQAHLVGHLSPFSASYQATLSQLSDSLRSLGIAPGQIGGTAQMWLEQTLIAQAQTLAYLDVFAYCAGLAFAVAPLAFLFSPITAGGRPAGGH